MNSAFRDDTDIELDELRASEQPSTNQHTRMPKNTRRPSEESLKSNVSVTVHSVETENDSRMESQQISKGGRRNFVIGILLLLLVVFLWTSSNFITQDLFEEGFDKPFLVTYLNTSSFALYLFPSLYRYWRRRSKSQDLPYDYLPVANEPQQQESEEDHLPTEPEQQAGRQEPANENVELPPLTTRETASLAATFCILWFVANWSVNASFRYTSVGSSTVLASTSGLFTMAVSRLLGIERLTIWKIGAVVTSFAGVILVSVADSGRPPTKIAPPPSSSSSSSSSMLPPPSDPLLGDFLALLSALFYALYLSLLKVRIRVESRVDMQLLFGFVGLFNILACWPLGLVLHLTGVEKFGWPTTGQEWMGVFVNMAVTFTSDFIYVIAMLKTTPLVVTLGLTLTIPLAIVGDYVLQSRGVSMIGLGGAMLVVAAFGVIGWGDSRAEETEPVEAVIQVGEDYNIRV